MSCDAAFGEDIIKEETSESYDSPKITVARELESFTIHLCIFGGFLLWLSL